MPYRTGDISVSANFGANIAEPLDAKNQSASTFSELATTPFPYKGLQRLVADEGANGTTYVLGADLTTWSKLVLTTTINEPTGSDSVLNIVSLTQTEYDAGTPVSTTLYLITDA